MINVMHVTVETRMAVNASVLNVLVILLVLLTRAIVRDCQLLSEEALSCKQRNDCLNGKYLTAFPLSDLQRLRRLIVLRGYSAVPVAVMYHDPSKLPIFLVC